ncbi:hypothetical protein [Actimicrobium antarcticum]|uniref:DUF2188 domain-containing protein n=1 Tax=Actimicrobium antarcticum TaxID=1051899 RepID=A0ABP7T6X3_9BURK
MTTETIGEYEIEFTGVALPGTDGWAAHLTIHGPSANPMHQNTTFAEQRVAVDTVFPDAASAEAEARGIGLSMLEKSSQPGTTPT